MHARSLSKLNHKTFDHGGEKICEAAVATIKNRKIRLLRARRGAGNYPPPLQPRDKNWSECAMVYGGSLKFLPLSERESKPHCAADYQLLQVASPLFQLSSIGFTWQITKGDDGTLQQVLQPSGTAKRGKLCPLCFFCLRLNEFRATFDVWNVYLIMPESLEINWILQRCTRRAHRLAYPSKYVLYNMITRIEIRIVLSF